MGSLPFDNFAAGELVVPSVTVRIEADRATLICVGPRDALDALVCEPTAVVAEPVAPSAPPDHFELISVQSHERFKELVAEAVDAIAAGEFQKVVVAREVEVRANRPFAPSDLLARLRALYPSCVTFSMGNFVGASPELLCRRTGSLARAHPLAGTIARSGDPEEDERLAKSLLASSKNRSEHGFVVDAIVEALRGFAPEVTASAEPHLLELRNVVHLATTIEAHLREPMPGALELAVALHPTPAVGGFPEQAALIWLEKHEVLDRDRYAGPLGYMDAAGDGEWWLGIRSALLSGSSARLIAGVGIVADSEPAAELAETQLKLQALLAAAVRP
jgi:menaquinone-specific isochorismate synthase